MSSARLLAAALLTPVLLVVPATASAQDGFFFGRPSAAVTVRFGHAQPSVDGALFETMIDRLTMDAGDFGSETFAAELLLPFGRRVDLGLGVGWAQSTVRSEFRAWTYEDDSPIAQTTKLRRLPLTVLGRVYPLARGRSVSDYAWIPNRFAPYVGGGAGWLWYRLEQYGDFVDVETLDIFESRYESSGGAFAAHALGGVDYWVTPRVAITAEGRYTWASATPTSQFQFDSVDLGGWQVTGGVAFRF